MKITLDILNEYFDNGWVRKQSHPDLPLTIWNYSIATQYEGKWDYVTLQCRGLVTDDNTGEIVARPFKKFFNIEEAKHTPTDDFEAFDKLDGSCIICFNYKGEWIFASRGSFISEQAQMAREIAKRHSLDSLDENCTYMFEILFKENRVVVDYGDTEAIIMLGAIRTIDGIELSYDDLYNRHSKYFDIVKRYEGISDYNLLRTDIDGINREGFVIRFSNGSRMKMKYEEYVRLHKIMTQISTTTVWETLSSGCSMESILTNVPDEFYSKIRDYQNSLETQFWKIADEAKVLFKQLYEDGMSKKDFIFKITDIPKPYRQLLILQFDIKMDGYSNVIWSYLRPEFTKL